MRTETNSYVKVITCICCVLIIVALLIIRNSPATGYESSIYKSTPTLAWVFLIFSLICGIGIVVHQVYRGKVDRDRTWILGLLLILLSYTTVLSMYIIRGYMLWGREDVLWHLGTTWDIAATGHFYASNYYPISHTLIAQLSQILGIDSMELFKYLPVLFALFYIAFMYLLARYILPSKGQVILATIASTVLVHHWYIGFGTSQLSILMLPLAIYLGIKFMSVPRYQQRMPLTIMFIILIFLYPPFHMQPAISIFIIIATIWVFPAIFRRLSKGSVELAPDYPKWHATAPILVIVCWFTWVSSSGIYESFLKNMYTLLVERGVTPLQSIAYGISSTMDYGYNILNVIDGFARVYGSTLLYMVIALIAFPIITKKLSARPNLINLYSLYGPLTVFVLIVLVLFVTQSFFGPNRFFVYILILCNIVVGFILSEMIGKARNLSRGHIFSKLITVSVVFILGLASIAGIYKVYPSPYTYSLGQQVTESEVKATEYAISHNDTNIPITDYYSVGIRAFWYLMPNDGEARTIWTSPLRWEPTIPFHFGYEKQSSLGASYAEDRYMMINSRFRKQYIEVFPDMAEKRFLPSDFEKLEDDFSLDKVYTNGELDSWYIHRIVASHSS
jgi:hypothetical protein